MENLWLNRPDTYTGTGDLLLGKVRDRPKLIVNKNENCFMDFVFAFVNENNNSHNL